MRCVLIAAALMFAAGLQSALCQAKVNLADISICLDPGHGVSADGVFANRGAYGYSETEKVLSVALHLKSLLEHSGIDTVILTRSLNSSDVSLTQRTAIANNNNVDWLHSLHSNAAPENINPSIANYVLALIEEEREGSDERATASPERGPGTGAAYWRGFADVMATLMSDNSARTYRTTNNGTKLDWTFYGGASGGFTLGVLRTSLMPATLSEGAFHTHPTQNLRNMNDQYRRAEAKALWKSFLEYYDVQPPPIRAALGIVTAKTTGAPLNEVLVETNGQSYKTNSYFDTFRNWEVSDSALGNGVYYFENLPAGSRPFTFRLEGYRDTTIYISVVDTFFTFQDVALSKIVTAAPQATGDIPLEFSLEQNYPNPFNPVTVIAFTLPKPGPVRLDILNLLGESVATLLDEEREAGTYRVTWNGTNQTGNIVPSGVYFYKLRHGSATLTRKMVFVR